MSADLQTQQRQQHYRHQLQQQQQQQQQPQPQQYQQQQRQQQKQPSSHQQYQQQHLRSGSIVTQSNPQRTLSQQMRHHLKQGVHRSINPLYPLPFLPDSRKQLLNNLDSVMKNELIRMIVERHKYNNSSQGAVVDMRVRALDSVVERSETVIQSQTF